MARNNNEAKIKFTAETREFNDAIKASDKTMANLRAEMKLNETQMKATGATVEGLEQKHSLLEGQLKASQAKTEALSKKIEAATRLFGENSNEVLELKTKLTQAQTAEEGVRQALEKCNRELTEQKTAAKEAESATKQLTDTIEKQQAEVDDLKEKYVEAVLQYGKNSKEAKDLARQLKDLSGELKDNKDEMDAAADKADKLDKSLDNASDSAGKAGDGFTVMKGVVADLASRAIQMAIGKVSEFIGYLADLPEATRELRQDMATLDTSFQRAGFSTEQATQTWKDLYAVFGEDDRAVEAANLIAKMSKDQQDLNEWVTITKGIWGTYQDSLPVEGLAEASNETAKTGQVTGVLADALNWSSEAASMFSKYMGEDVTTAEDAFNEALKECSNEQERQQLITDTLTKLYGGAATEYEKASGAQIDAKNAAADATLAQNELADAVEPCTTAWTGMKTELLVGITPAVTTVCGWLEKAFGWLKKHPAVMYTLIGILGTLAVALTVAAVAQWAMNAAWLASPVTWIIVGIVAAVAALIAIGVLLAKNWDKIRAKGEELWGKLKNAFSKGKEAVVNKCTELKNAAVEKFNSLKEAAVNKFNALKDGAVEKFNALRDKVKGVVDKIKGFFTNLKLKLPKIKLPHFKLTGEFSLKNMTVPKLSIDWYAKGGIFTKPTIFNTSRGLKGVGEAGAEAVLPIDRLQGYIEGAIEKSAQTVDLRYLANSIEDLANRPIDLNINGRAFAQATAGDTDSVGGMRTNLMNRGLALA